MAYKVPILLYGFVTNAVKRLNYKEKKMFQQIENQVLVKKNLIGIILGMMSIQVEL